MDKLSYQKTFDTYFAPLCRYANKYLADKPASEDAVSDVFFNVWELHERIEDTPYLEHYLFHSVHNKCLNLLRDRKQTCDLDDASEDTYLSDAGHLHVEIKELSTHIDKAILSLPPRSREVFIRSRYENLNNREIADTMHISVKTVEGHITKSLKHIKKRLADTYLSTLF
jgi:RNA polymerase sigma-70 factor (ECF subfamily)